MTAAISFEQLIAMGVDLGFYGVVGSNGYLNGGSLVAPAAGNAAGSPMLRLKGIVGADPTVPEAEVIPVPGDNTNQGSFIVDSDASPAFTIEKSVFDMAVDALTQGTLVYQYGDIKLGVLQPADAGRPDMCWVLQSPVKRKDAGQEGRKGWSGYIIPLTSASPLGRDRFATRAVATDRIRVAVSKTSMLPDGLVLDDTNLGTTGGAMFPFTSDYPIYLQRWTGDGVATTFNLAFTPPSAEAVQVRINGVLQLLTTNYTVNISAKTMTFLVAPANNAAIVGVNGIAL